VPEPKITDKVREFLRVHPQTDFILVSVEAEQEIESNSIVVTSVLSDEQLKSIPVGPLPKTLGRLPMQVCYALRSGAVLFFAGGRPLGMVE